MNTDIMYGDTPLYAYVYILIRRQIKFPYYLRVEHQQGYRNDIFKIECYSYAEVDYYRELCSKMTSHLSLLEIEYVRQESDISDTLNGGTSLCNCGRTDSGYWREDIDGKDFDPSKEIRETYIAKILGN